MSGSKSLGRSIFFSVKINLALWWSLGLLLGVVSPLSARHGGEIEPEPESAAGSIAQPEPLKSQSLILRQPGAMSNAVADVSTNPPAQSPERGAVRGLVGRNTYHGYHSPLNSLALETGAAQSGTQMKRENLNLTPASTPSPAYTKTALASANSPGASALPIAALPFLDVIGMKVSAPVITVRPVASAIGLMKNTFSMDPAIGGAKAVPMTPMVTTAPVVDAPKKADASMSKAGQTDYGKTGQPGVK